MISTSTRSERPTVPRQRERRTYQLRDIVSAGPGSGCRAAALAASRAQLGPRWPGDAGGSPGHRASLVPVRPFDRRLVGTAGSMWWPSWQNRIDVGLIPVDSPCDGLCHLVEEEHYVAEVTSGRTPRVRGQCERSVVVGALVQAPLPGCRGCAAAAAVLVRDFAEKRVDRMPRSVVRTAAWSAARLVGVGWRRTAVTL